MYSEVESSGINDSCIPNLLLIEALFPSHFVALSTKQLNSKHEQRPIGSRGAPVDSRVNYPNMLTGSRLSSGSIHLSMNNNDKVDQLSCEARSRVNAASGFVKGGLRCIIDKIQTTRVIVIYGRFGLPWISRRY